MSSFSGSLFLVLLLVFSACSSSPPQTIAAPTAEKSPLVSPSATHPLEAPPTFTATSVVTSAISPTRLAPSSTPEPPNPQITMLPFSPWELVLALAWSPDGNTIAAAAGESIHLYNARTLQERLKLTPGVWSTSLAFSPDSALLASGSRDGRLRLWDAATGTLKLSFPAHKKAVNSVAFSPDGHWLASGGNDAVARLWDVSTGKKLTQLIGGTFTVPSIVFSRDGSSLAIVNGPIIRLRDVKTSRFVKTFRGDEPFYSLALSPDGLSLASGTAVGTVMLWDLAGGSLRLTLTDPELTPASPALFVWSVAFSPDGGTLAAAGSDGKIRFWDASSGKLLSSWAAHARAATSLAFSPDGRVLATGGLDSILRLWRVR